MTRDSPPLSHPPRGLRSPLRKAGSGLPPRLDPDGLRARRFRSLRTITALILREMATTYGRSPGGYLWAILEPVAALAMFSIGFALVFNAPPIGNSFPLFYATGFLPFMLFNDVANKMATSINFSRPLLAYPAVTFLDALIARFLLTVLTHMMVAYIVFFGIIIIFGARADLDLPVILLGFSLGAFLGIGVGTLNCYLMTAFPVWERSWQIATRPMFIISGIFFTYDSMPRFAQEILWYNPLVHVIGVTRDGFYGAYRADYISVTLVLGVASLTLLAGLLLLWRHHRTLLES
ncbi:ABC transporter permease [Szabonella alba]|uniref:Transport permease protein n=1 Tax=Szabonella alba TaxID=2804194 RepID=A0A8K0VBW1_9RHOB|nr:ABC transporter permease [Szabonella alba]MBL4919329.1 ABC transporter permease [Szabonella alba]